MQTKRPWTIRQTVITAASFVIVIGLIYLEFHSLDNDGRHYADAAIVKIVSGWNQQELISRASPEFMHEVGSQIPEAFSSWRMLGALAGFYGAHGSVKIGILQGARVRLIASYVALAKFSGGYAQVNIDLIKVMGGWKIRGFGVRPLTAPPPGRSASGSNRKHLHVSIS